jgi:hypothetical protein
VLFARIVGVVAADGAAGVELQSGNGMVYCGSGGGLCNEWDGEEITGGAVVYDLQISGVVVTSWQRSGSVGADDVKRCRWLSMDCGEGGSGLFAVCTTLTVVMAGCLQCIELGCCCWVVFGNAM